jgi:hypothetical protein
MAKSGAGGYSGIGGSTSSMSDGKARVISPSGGGKSSVVKGSGTDVLAFGPKYGTKTAGLSRFDVTGRSLNRGKRKM